MEERVKRDSVTGRNIHPLTTINVSPILTSQNFEYMNNFIPFLVFPNYFITFILFLVFNSKSGGGSKLGQFS